MVGSGGDVGQRLVDDVGFEHLVHGLEPFGVPFILVRFAVGVVALGVLVVADVLPDAIDWSVGGRSSDSEVEDAEEDGKEKAEVEGVSDRDALITASGVHCVGLEGLSVCG